MILDKRNEFCDATSVALTAGAAWQNIGNVIDRQASGNTLVDLGQGEPLYLVIRVTTDIDAAGAGSIAFRLASDSTGTIHASTSTVHYTSATIVTATTPPAGLLAGVTLAAVALPGGDYEQFLGIQCLVLTQDTVAGNVDAFLTRDVAKYINYADAL